MNFFYVTCAKTVCVWDSSGVLSVAVCAQALCEMEATTLAWNNTEVPDESFYWPLTTQPGNEREELPIDRYKTSFFDGLDRKKVVGLEAQTGSGKTMRSPEWLYEAAYRAWDDRKCVVLVQDSIFSVTKVVNSLVELYEWNRDRIHVRTSDDKDTYFRAGYTQLTVINYGIL